MNFPVPFGLARVPAIRKGTLLLKAKGGYLLHWLADDNRHRYWAMPAELLAGDGSEYRRILLSRGMRLSNSVKARQLLSLFIQQMGELATQKAISVNCIGWHHHAYVHPRLIFYPGEHSNNPCMVLQTMHPIESTNGRRLSNPRWQPSAAQSQPARQHSPTYVLRERQHLG